MEDICIKLQEWKSNIDYDITQDYLTLEERFKYIHQSIQLGIAISMLEGIGSNNNIPKTIYISR